MIPAVCRDCAAAFSLPEDGDPAARRCPACRSVRILQHGELDRLPIAHIDCDAFYASVEKRDRPELADKPVLVGGRERGVVAACCYIARLYGIRSAMPVAQALKLCPDAVTIRPDMARYSAVGRQIRELMHALTPTVQPLSIDEAYLDLSDAPAEIAHHPAAALAAFARHVETEIGLTVSVGLSYCKFLAKLASEEDKPRGFAAIGRAEALAFLGPKPVSVLQGVGPSLAHRLARDGLHRIDQLRQRPREALIARYGRFGAVLHDSAHGIDERPVRRERIAKSISAENTFAEDLWDYEVLHSRLAGQAQRVAERLSRAAKAATAVTLKLKDSRFRTITRTRRLNEPSQRADVLLAAAASLLLAECDGRAFRLIGLGVHDFADPALADPPDLLARAQAGLFDPPAAAGEPATPSAP